MDQEQIVIAKGLNTMTFDGSTSEGRQLAISLIKFLMDYNQFVQHDYNDIHIYQDNTDIKIDFIQTSYNGAYGGTFEYISFDDIQGDVN